MKKRRTLAAVGLAFAVIILSIVSYRWFVAVARQRSFAELQARAQTWGGDVFAEEALNTPLEPIRRRLGRDLSLQILGSPGVNVSATVTDATKEQLSQLLLASPMRRVMLAGSENLDDDWVAGIDPTSSMFQLILAGTGVTDRSVPKILEMRGLSSLELAETAISDGVFERLINLPKLRELHVGGPNIQAIRWFDLKFVDDSGEPSIHPGRPVHLRGSLKVDQVAWELVEPRVLVRSEGDLPPWRNVPYGWSGGMIENGRLVEDGPGSWKLDVDLPAIRSGKSTVEGWIRRPVGGRSVAVYYRLEPHSIELAPGMADPVEGRGIVAPSAGVR